MLSRSTFTLFYSDSAFTCSHWIKLSFDFKLLFIFLIHCKNVFGKRERKSRKSESRFGQFLIEMPFTAIIYENTNTYTYIRNTWLRASLRHTQCADLRWFLIGCWFVCKISWSHVTFSCKPFSFNIVRRDRRTNHTKFKTELERYD